FLKLLRYGLPQGVENFLCTFCFVFIVSSFHSYGDDVATATTIVFNWDGFSFHPLLGIQVGVTTLVAQALGRNDAALALRTAHSGFKVAVLYAGCMILLFLTCTRPLVAFFTPESSGLDYSQVRAYAHPMLRLAGVYLMTDAIMLISGGVLRGAGDTFWSMVLHLVSNIFLGGLLLLMVHVLHFPPMRAWFFFVFAGMASISPIFLRYKLGRWKTLRIIAPGGKDPRKSPEAQAASDVSGDLY
ncbi:MAG: MATE family efflux transporter, partial [Oligosphaeraceae bacterium]